MTDRADEIAREWDGDEKLARIIRAYGDERVEKRLASICDTETADEYEERLEALVKIANEARNAALEAQADLYRELAARVDDDEDSLVAEITRLREALRTCQTMGHVDCLCLGVATDALKEKP